MNSAELLVDAFGRVHGVAHAAVDGLTAAELNFRPDCGAASGNSIGWLVWHLARVQDDHVAGVAGIGQVWMSQGWAAKFGLPFEPSAIGYGHTDADVTATRIESGQLLLGYLDAVHEQTVAYVQGLTADDLDRVVDESWHPVVTLGVRLVSVIADDLQHAGQAAYLRGLLPS
jgi:hypothetical protein